jgi:hypothetical protein
MNNLVSTLIQHVMRANQDIGIVNFIMERKDAIVRNRQQTLQVHNVVTITMVDGLLTGEKELVHSISIILGL